MCVIPGSDPKSNKGTLISVPLQETILSSAEWGCRVDYSDKRRLTYYMMAASTASVGKYDIIVEYLNHEHHEMHAEDGDDDTPCPEVWTLMPKGQPLNKELTLLFNPWCKGR